MNNNKSVDDSCMKTLSVIPYEVINTVLFGYLLEVDPLSIAKFSQISKGAYEFTKALGKSMVNRHLLEGSLKRYISQNSINDEEKKQQKIKVWLCFHYLIKFRDSDEPICSLDVMKHLGQFYESHVSAQKREEIEQNKHIAHCKYLAFSTICALADNTDRISDYRSAALNSISSMAKKDPALVSTALTIFKERALSDPCYYVRFEAVDNLIPFVIQQDDVTKKNIIVLLRQIEKEVEVTNSNDRKLSLSNRLTLPSLLSSISKSIEKLQYSLSS